MSTSDDPAASPIPPADALRDPERLHLLADTGLVDACAAARLPTLDRVARLAARAVRAPIAQVNLMTADAQIPAAAFVDATQPGARGAPLDEADADLGGAWRRPVGLDASYCQHVVHRGVPLLVADAGSDPLVRDIRATRESGIGAYAAAPVMTPNGSVLGTVCVVDFGPRTWTSADVAALVECAAIAGEEVAARLGAAAALRDSDDRLQLALRAGGLGTWSLDLRTEVLQTSARCREHFGRTPSQSLTYADVRRAIHPDDRTRVDEIVQSAMASGGDCSAEYRVLPSDGTVRWIAAHGHVARGAQGAAVRIVGVAQDVTARRVAEEGLRQALDTAEAANRAKSEFLAVMSHELRTPLNAIAGYVELLAMGLRGPVTAAQLDDLARIRRSQQHLLGLINEVLNYARLETGAVQFELGDVLVGELLVAAEALVVPQAQRQSLALHVHEPDPGLTVRADAEKVRQVLVNLLSNAIKFTDRGGRIDVTAAADGDAVAIRVADTGIGIPAEKLAAIFEPFVQVRADLTRPHEGTGLGLAISRDLARAMNGELTVESAPGVGSTFTLTLPSGRQTAVGSR
ncbi:MAG: PAS domain-containing protein [Gemmatirosa sp.]|nr:PAS domain-containing protein [Gemmatirosa sp.]